MNKKLSLSKSTQITTRLPGGEWQPYDESPGIFEFEPNVEVGIRIQNIDDQELRELLSEIDDHPQVIFLNLSENRKISNRGLEYLKMLPRLTMLNLSSCDITNEGLTHLKTLRNLEWLNLSFCNRITGVGLKALQALNRLTYLDLQGSVKVKSADVKRLGLKNTTIKK